LPPPEANAQPSQVAPAMSGSALSTTALAAPVVQQPKPKVAKAAPQKSYALLSDAQIAGIKDRLKLSSSQEYYWPSVETALRAVARKLNAEKLSNPHAAAAQLDPDCEEVQQLKSAAMPLLFQLREDQKDEVRKLARIIGLEKVASAI
jgi:ABC-type transporter Mla MlaB component